MSGDDELRLLRIENEELKRRLGNEQWTSHLIDKKADAGGLPVPRLELVWSRCDDKPGYEWYCRYDLVKNHLLDEIHRIPLGGTSRGGGMGPVQNGKVDAPFRDGAHIAFDARDLNLPAYAICGDVVTKLDPYEHMGANNSHTDLAAKVKDNE